jgi:hypothetical protein
MRDDLVAAQVEIDPVVGASSLGAAEQFDVEPPRSGNVVDRKGVMERRKAHVSALSFPAKRSNPAFE